MRRMRTVNVFFSSQAALLRTLAEDAFSSCQYSEEFNMLNVILDKKKEHDEQFSVNEESNVSLRSVMQLCHESFDGIVAELRDQNNIYHQLLLMIKLPLFLAGLCNLPQSIDCVASRLRIHLSHLSIQRDTIFGFSSVREAIYS